MLYCGESYELRNPCKRCGSLSGRIETKGNQDCVYCDCGTFQYNAPKTETGREVRTVERVHKSIRPKDRASVLMRANGRCELCGSRINLHVGHLLSVEAGLRLGMNELQLNDPENLCAMCEACNLGVGKEPIPARFLMALVLARIASNV